VIGVAAQGHEDSLTIVFAALAVYQYCVEHAYARIDLTKCG
jgi:hypothetical protein